VGVSDARHAAHATRHNRKPERGAEATTEGAQEGQAQADRTKGAVGTHAYESAPAEAEGGEEEMKALRMAGLAVAVTLLFGVVYAVKAPRVGNTSGWVLWEKTMKEGGSTGVWITEWEPLDGFDYLADCQRSGQEVIEGARAFMSSGGRKLVDVRPDGRSAVYSVEEDGAQRTVDYRLLCFPSLFDARPSRP
jgi:hypothetical protein